MNPQGIAVGDWVMVVRSTTCCAFPHELGLTFKVVRIGNDQGGFCRFCGIAREIQVCASQDGIYGLPLAILKKLDPPAEGETREAYKNIKVTA